MDVEVPVVAVRALLCEGRDVRPFSPDHRLKRLREPLLHPPQLGRGLVAQVSVREGMCAAVQHQPALQRGVEGMHDQPMIREPHVLTGGQRIQHSQLLADRAAGHDHD